jgi:hypothetical protein
LAPGSFGLRPEDKKYILEEIFLLMEYCNFSWTEAWDTQVELRKWFIERKKKEMHDIEEARKRASKAPAQ